MKFVKNTSLQILFVLFTFTVILTSCDSADDEEVRLDNNDAGEKIEVKENVDSAAADTSNTLSKDANQFMGTWTGTFDSRNATLNITNQTENEFQGELSVNYHDQLVKPVSGTFNKEQKTFTMRDTQSGRFAGKYSGKLSDDMTKMDGTFTLKTDNSNYNFNLTKK